MAINNCEITLVWRINMPVGGRGHHDCCCVLRYVMHYAAHHPSLLLLFISVFVIVIPLIEMCGCDWLKSRHVV